MLDTSWLAHLKRHRKYSIEAVVDKVIAANENDRVEAMRHQYEVNVFGPLKVATALLPHFRERRSGINVFIGSLSGQVGHALTGPYASSKFALEGRPHSCPRLLYPYDVTRIDCP